MRPPRVEKGVPTAGEFTEKHSGESSVTLDAEESYRVQHRAPGRDGYSNPIAELDKSFRPDVLEHPEYYGSGESDPETMAQLKRVVANPLRTVKIYRALPSGIAVISQGDWVTLSEKYARH